MAKSSNRSAVYGQGLGVSTVHRRFHVTTTGSAGSATGSVYIPCAPGRVRAVAVDYHASAPATTDLTLKGDGLADGSTGNTFLTVSNSATDIPVRALGSPNAVDEGRAVTAATDATDGGAFFKHGLCVSLAQSDALTNAAIVDVWIDLLHWERVTLRPVGADGSAVDTKTVRLARAGVVMGIAVDFANQPATTDLTLKAEDTNGYTMFASANSATDLGPTPVALGLIGIDEANGALAATDGSAGGCPFKNGVFLDVAQGDGFGGSGNEEIFVDLWMKI